MRGCISLMSLLSLSSLVGQGFHMSNELISAEWCLPSSCDLSDKSWGVENCLHTKREEKWEEKKKCFTWRVITAVITWKYNRCVFISVCIKLNTAITVNANCMERNKSASTDEENVLLGHQKYVLSDWKATSDQDLTTWLQSQVFYH